MDDEKSKKAFVLAIKHYFRQLRIDWKFSVPGMLLTGIGTILVVYVPALIIAKILQKFSNSGVPSLHELIPYILIYGLIWIVGEMCWRLAIHLLIKAEVKGMERLYNDAMRYLLEKDLDFFHNNFAGSLTTKTRNYAGRYIEVVDTIMFNIAPYIIPLVFISFILWSYSPLIVLVLLGMLVVVIILVTPLIRYRRKLVTARETASTKTTGYVADIYSNIDAVRAYSNEKWELAHHRNYVSDLGEKSKKSWNFQNQKIDMVVSPLYVLTNVLGLIVALNIAQKSGLKIEVVFLTFTYFAGITRFLWEFNDIYRRLETSFSEAAQFTGLLDIEPKIKDASKPIDFKVNKGSIEFKNVYFDHNETDTNEALFNNLSIKIKPGEKIGLVGHSGGGKTTLTKLIMRLMDISGGEILIDGQDISLVKQADLRSKLSYVPQEPIMFHRSLSENIAYGKKNATDKEIVKAAKMAHAEEFIKKLADGYKTLVGERGVKLSGGQRQRIAIARAMLKDAPILLLDEATSALDSDSEQLIQKALFKLMEGKTAIVIAHRLSTIQKMDRILVLDNGVVVEEGTHKELVRKNGKYSELWKHQSGGFLED